MSRRTRIGIVSACVVVGGLLAWLAWRRFATFHNETFDLAFYARMAWGLSRAQFWEPITSAHILGVHVSPVLAPLGWLGMLFGTVPVLLGAQAAAVVAAAWPLARFGQRRMGALGAALGAAVWLLFPNLGHVATFEFHPGTLAVLPLAWALDGLDRRCVRTLVWSVLGVLACREDLGLVTGLIGLMAMRMPGSDRRFELAGRYVAVTSFGWVLLFALVFHPLFAPDQGSLQLHFGRWGDSVPEALLAMVADPIGLAAHLLEPARLAYLPTLLAPVAFLPLLRARWLLPALPLVAVNLLSDWPTTTDLDSHYQTPLLPMLVAAAVDGASLVATRSQSRQSRRLVTGGLIALVGASHLAWGGTPIAADFDAAAFRSDERAQALPPLLEQIDEGASVQAPYAVLPHVAERMAFGPPPPPERVADFVLLDGWHRRRWARDEHLLRTTEEPTFRGWLARSDHGLVAARGDYLLLRRGADPRGGPSAEYLHGEADPTGGRRLAACLAVLGADLHQDDLVLELVARAPCPFDLAVRLGAAKRPRRVDLLFDGRLSPAHLTMGDRLRSVHPLEAREREGLQRLGYVHLGAVRASGARPEHDDPVTVSVPLSR